jgi:hypothetical protein
VTFGIVARSTSRGPQPGLPEEMFVALAIALIGVVVP